MKREEKDMEETNIKKVINRLCWCCAVVAVILTSILIFTSGILLPCCKPLRISWQMFLIFVSALTVLGCWLITCITVVYIKTHQIQMIKESKKENSTLDRAIIEKALSYNPIRCCRCKCKRYIIKKNK